MLFPSMDFESGFLNGYSSNDLATSPGTNGDGAGVNLDFPALSGMMEAEGQNSLQRAHSSS